MCHDPVNVRALDVDPAAPGMRVLYMNEIKRFR